MFSKKMNILLMLALLLCLFIIPHSFALDPSSSNDLSIADNSDSNDLVIPDCKNVKDIDEGDVLLDDASSNGATDNLSSSDKVSDIYKSNESSNSLLNENNNDKSANAPNDNGADTTKSTKNIDIFIISDNPGTNILDDAFEELSTIYDFTNM